MNNYSQNGHLTSRRYYVFPSVSDQKPGSATLKPVLRPTFSFRPASPQMHLQRGLALYAQGHTQEALWDFFESVGAEPRDALGHYMCGLAFKALGLGEEAQAEWETVLALTSGGETASSVEMQWARSMAQRFLRRGNGILNVGTENRGIGTRRQEDLERAIRDAVHRHGDCYVQDQFSAAQLKVTMEEQIIGWKQSFSAREGLECQPYQVTISEDSRQDGVIFKRCDLSATGDKVTRC